MNKLSFVINEGKHDISVGNLSSLGFGRSETLSNVDTDIAYSQDWYPQGYKSLKFLDQEQFESLQEGLTRNIKKIVETELGITADNFAMDKYHHVVKTDEDHLKVVSKTRDLFPEDFNFCILDVLPKFEELLGFRLTDTNPFDNSKVHIIVRVNRPFSTDFNPPHKDIYEGVDINNYLPKFINIWIPICGVTENSSLPVAPSSHLLPENQILRTFDGAEVEGKKYRVRIIKEWGGSNRLERAKVTYGDALFFSSHLVHGLAINQEVDTTRVALEFRLFKKS